MIEIVVGVIAWALTVLGAIVWAYGAGQDAIIARQALEDRAAVVLQDAAARATASSLADFRTQHEAITNDIRREIAEHAVYRDCRHSAEQLQRINAAITAQPGRRSGDRVVPAPDRAGR